MACGEGSASITTLAALDLQVGGFPLPGFRYRGRERTILKEQEATIFQFREHRLQRFGHREKASTHVVDHTGIACKAAHVPAHGVNVFLGCIAQQGRGPGIGPDSRWVQAASAGTLHGPRPRPVHLFLQFFAVGRKGQRDFTRQSADRPCVSFLLRPSPPRRMATLGRSECMTFIDAVRA